MRKRLFRSEMTKYALFIALPILWVAPTLWCALILYIINLPRAYDPQRRPWDMISAVGFATRIGVDVDAIDCDGRGNCTVRTTANAWLGLRCAGLNEPCFLAWVAPGVPAKRGGEQ
jgi:hypothetical protein